MVEIWLFDITFFRKILVEFWLNGDVTEELTGGSVAHTTRTESFPCERKRTKQEIQAPECSDPGV